MGRGVNITCGSQFEGVELPIQKNGELVTKLCRSIAYNLRSIFFCFQLKIHEFQNSNEAGTKTVTLRSKILAKNTEIEIWRNYLSYFSDFG